MRALLSALPCLLLTALTALTALSACGGADHTASDRETGGTLIVVVPAEPSTLFPPLASNTHELAVVSVLFDRLAEIGDDLETYGDRGFRPRLAASWTWATDSLSVAFRLDSAAQWHDGAPVRAEDVRYTFAVYTADSVGAEARSNLGNIDSVTVRDSLTAVYWFKRRMPQQFFDAVYHTYILPSHLLDTIPMERLARADVARQPVGTGRFRFARWDPGARIEVIADTANSRGRAILDRVVWSFVSDLGAATIKLFAGDADFFEMIRSQDLPQVTQSPTLRSVDNRSLQYNFLGFNLRARGDASRPHPIFGETAVRRALHMAVDRETLVRNVFDSLGLVALGPAPRALIPDTSAFNQIPYDLAGARALLDSIGWMDRNADGIRDRDGMPLAFDLLAPGSSEARKSYAINLQEQLRAIGVRATPLLLDINAYVTRVEAHDFDAYSGGWQTDPGLQGLRQTWRSTGSSNYGSYASPVFDALLDSATSTFDREASRGYWSRAFQQIVSDAPAIWLYEQRTPVVVHRRVNTAPLRADGWYHGLADWSIAPTARIDRDRIGLGSAR